MHLILFGYMEGQLSEEKLPNLANRLSNTNVQFSFPPIAKEKRERERERKKERKKTTIRMIMVII